MSTCTTHRLWVFLSPDQCVCVSTHTHAKAETHDLIALLSYTALSAQHGGARTLSKQRPLLSLARSLEPSPKSRPPTRYGTTRLADDIRHSFPSTTMRYRAVAFNKHAPKKETKL